MYEVSSFYAFTPMSDLDGSKTALRENARRHEIEGLVILAPEGLNATVAAPSADQLKMFTDWIRDQFALRDEDFKTSRSEIRPFQRFVIKERPEIVSLGAPELVPPRDPRRALTPTEWNEALKSDDVLLIDTRNTYETDLGTFRGALKPGTEKFSEFPEYLRGQKIEPDQKILIFCTGGIRCEKGLLELERHGYHNVYQLRGGILNYLAHHPNEAFEGECFVFDHRVAVDQELKPSARYGLCRHCGQPATVQVCCENCASTVVVCDGCRKEDLRARTCSKNCRTQVERRQASKARRPARPSQSR